MHLSVCLFCVDMCTDSCCIMRLNSEWLLFWPWPCAALRYSLFKHDLSHSGQPILLRGIRCKRTYKLFNAQTTWNKLYWWNPRRISEVHILRSYILLKLVTFFCHITNKRTHRRHFINLTVHWTCSYMLHTHRHPEYLFRIVIVSIANWLLLLFSLSPPSGLIRRSLSGYEMICMNWKARYWG